MEPRPREIVQGGGREEFRVVSLAESRHDGHQRTARQFQVLAIAVAHGPAPLLVEIDQAEKLNVVPEHMIMRRPFVAPSYERIRRTSQITLRLPRNKQE